MSVDYMPAIWHDETLRARTRSGKQLGNGGGGQVSRIVAISQAEREIMLACNNVYRPYEVESWCIDTSNGEDLAEANWLLMSIDLVER
jgi:hypothetical protein